MIKTRSELNRKEVFYLNILLWLFSSPTSALKENLVSKISTCRLKIPGLIETGGDCRVSFSNSTEKFSNEVIDLKNENTK